MKSKIMIIALVLFLVGGASGFFGGVQYQKSKNPLSGMQRFGAMVAGTTGGSNQRRGLTEGQTAVSGEVISKDETSLTLKLPDNSSKIILLTDSVSVRKTSESNIGEVALGEQIVVQGQQNQDGSVVAQSIQSGSFNFIPQIPQPSSTTTQ
ncbi:hypothetical protein L6252_03870 [Candidatus Parcubacteria bacterium]|nr:hypothetical protein [Candidatus Parcubacteria bacterium]